MTWRSGTRSLSSLRCLVGLAMAWGSLAFGESAAADDLYLATLTSQCAVQTLGSGHATLRVASDESGAELSFQFSNLTGTVSAKHVHAPDGLILFDLDTHPADGKGVHRWSIAQAGNWSPAQIRTALHSGGLYLNLHTALCPDGEIKGAFRQAAGNQTFTPPPAPPPLPASPAVWSRTDAARFLAQTTFGARMSELTALAAALQAQGPAAFEQWIAAQLALPGTATRHLKYLDDLVSSKQVPRDELYSDHVMESLWNRAVFAPDQLRQRVALALSEILVVSDVDGDVWGSPEGTASYMDALQRGAFGNYRKLLEDVTLSPTMGVYLDMLSNDRADPAKGRKPNENYAREILQLFSIGLYRLHPDGTLQLGPDGQPIATYGQEEIEGFAAVFTGWTHARQKRADEWRFYWPEPRFRELMQPWPAHHEPGPKRLLDGVVQSGGRGARADLKVALDQIFRHPNVGPFVCKQLIQRLVTSNPTPAYVYRCGQAFADNGQGARGDMSAVVRTIVLDYEARSREVAAQPGFGKLKEPIVRFAGLMRALEAFPSAGDNRLRYYWLDSPQWGLGQNPLRSPTVFNFFEPTYSHPGEVARAGLTSPEFKITTETTVFGTPNFLGGVLEGWMYDPDDTPKHEELRFKWSAWQGLDNGQVMDRLNLLFFSGGMSAGTRDILLTAFRDPDLWPPNDSPEHRLERIRTLIWMTFLSPESLVQR